MPANTKPSARDDGPMTDAMTASGSQGGPPNPPSRGAAATGLVSRIPTDGPQDRVFINDAGRALIERLAAEGANQQTIARALGISRRTLGRAFEAQPEVKEAFEDGLAVQEQALVTMLRSKAREGNITAAIFLLKGRHGWRDTGVETGGVPAVAVQINLPAAMSPEDYKRQLKDAADG